MERPLAHFPARRILNAHLSSDELAAVVDGRLPAARRAQLSAHLAACRQCRSELAFVTQIVDTAPPRRPVSRPWRAVSLGAAAAAILLFVSLPALRRRSASTADVRSAVSSANAISVIVPSAGISSDVGSVRFSWRAVAGVSTYRLFITDSVGVPVRTFTTVDTAVALLDSARLRPGRYFWYVDALRGDGSSIASPQTAFSIRPR